MNGNNFHYAIWYNEGDSWPYAYPEDIYSQIVQYNENSYERKVLIDILTEEANFFIPIDSIFLSDDLDNGTNDIRKPYIQNQSLQRNYMYDYYGQE